MNYYLIAGERSGDLHAANLMKAISKKDASAVFRFFGGDFMQAAGGTLVRHYKEMAYMGLWEVISNIDKVFANLRYCKSDLLNNRPDVLILVDYSGFNLRIAAFAKKHGIPVFYYISPKIWAWNVERANTIKKLVDRMFVIFPFEKDFYRKFGYEVDYVGNPTLDAINEFIPNPDFRVQNNLGDKPIIAVLPGSRKAEVENMLHFMVSILPSFMEYQFVIAGVNNLDKRYYEAFSRHGIVEVVYEQTYDLLKNADMALVTSGTATLETALFKVPQVVCYSTSLMTYLFARSVKKVDYISLVNIITGREIVKELIQDEFIPSRVIEELNKIRKDKAFRNQILEGYAQLNALLGETGASEKTAELMIGYARNLAHH